MDGWLVTAIDLLTRKEKKETERKAEKPFLCLSGFVGVEGKACWFIFEK